MTKAALKNMLRLMEEVEADGDGSLELDQYAQFIRQQDEILVGAERGRGDEDGEDDDDAHVCRKPAEAVTAAPAAPAALNRDSLSGNGTGGRESTPPLVACKDNGTPAAVVPSSSSAIFVTAASRETTADDGASGLEIPSGGTESAVSASRGSARQQQEKRSGVLAEEAKPVLSIATEAMASAGNVEGDQLPAAGGGDTFCEIPHAPSLPQAKVGRGGQIVGYSQASECVAVRQRALPTWPQLVRPPVKHHQYYSRCTARANVQW